MKQLTCEMCGSNDLVKQDGVFVCQSCGCKYSVEEAKKMMVEGTVEVTGTVKVDSSDRLKNLYTLARRARDDQNVQDAAKYYHEIRIEDPNSWEAAFYGVYFTALNCRIGEIEVATQSITNAVQSVSLLIQNNVPKDEQQAAYTEMLLRTWQAGQILFNASNDTYVNASYSDAMSDFVDRATACILTMTAAGISAETIFYDYPLAEMIYKQTIEVCEGNSIMHNYSKICKDRLNDMKPKLRAVQQKKNDEYWKEHAEEKQKYEAQIAGINSEIKTLQEQSKQYDIRISEIKKDLSQEISAETQLLTIKTQQAELNRQKSSLGLFAGKQKKQLQEQIDVLQTQINKIEEEVRVQKKAIQDDVSSRIAVVEEERKPLIDKINSLEKEKNKIIDELKKDR